MAMRSPNDFVEMRYVVLRVQYARDGHPDATTEEQ